MLSRIIILLSILVFIVIPSKGQSMDKQKGYAYIKGDVKVFNNYGGQKDFLSINYFDWSQKSPTQYYLEVDSNGFFSDLLHLLNSQGVILNYNGSFKTVFVSPKDTNTININGSTIKSNNLESELVSTFFNELKLVKGKHVNTSYTNFSSFKKERFKIYKKELSLNSNYAFNYNASSFL